MVVDVRIGDRVRCWTGPSVCFRSSGCQCWFVVISLTPQALVREKCQVGSAWRARAAKQGHPGKGSQERRQAWWRGTECEVWGRDVEGVEGFVGAYIKYQTDADHRDEGSERRHVAPTNTRASPGAGVIELLNNQPAVAVVLRLRRAEGAHLVAPIPVVAVWRLFGPSPHDARVAAAGQR